MIKLKNIEAYQGKTQVFKNLSFSINQGECVAIIGPNGSGKSTLLKLLSREIYPVHKTNSHLSLFGKQRINVSQLREKIGFVSSDFHARFEVLDSGLDIVISAFFGAVGLRKNHQPTSEQKKIALATMQKLDIEDLKDHPFYYLSSGQQRRVLLARALVHEPEVLIFDEPTNNLDIASAVKLLNDMRYLAQQGTSIVLVTHHLQEIIPEISRVIGLQNGQIAFDEEKSKALNQKNLSNLFDTPLHINKSHGYYQWSPIES